MCIQAKEQRKLLEQEEKKRQRAFMDQQQREFEEAEKSRKVCVATLPYGAIRHDLDADLDVWMCSIAMITGATAHAARCLPQHAGGSHVHQAGARCGHPNVRAQMLSSKHARER